MKGRDLGPARERLGDLWGAGRPLSKAELGRVLGLKGRDPGATIHDLERKPDQDLTGPMARAIEAWLGGFIPPDLDEALAPPPRPPE